ncbi:MAG: response regulator transcription factor [Dehalococcoidia bacterium]|nr:response regulator transcription factor [Dehalococcoidia bacterium]
MHTDAPFPGLADLPPLVGMRLLVVSHSLERAADRARRLESSGYRVVICGEPPQARLVLSAANPEAVIVDLGRELGFPADVVTSLRSATPVPVLVVACAGTLAEMVRVFEAGADAYCRQDCPAEEIDLRLRALWRRLRFEGAVPAHEPPAEVVHVGDIEIDLGAQVVRKHGELVALSPTEYRLLVSLAERPGEVVPSRALIARVWGDQYAGESHYLRLYVRYLRQKLEDDPSRPRYIVNRWGAGYTLATPPRAA